MQEALETVFGWAVMIGLVIWYIRALRRHRKKPQLRMWNPFDPSQAQPGQPFFGQGAPEWMWYVIGMAISATIVHFVVVR